MASHLYERLPIQDSSFVMFERGHLHMHVGALGLFEASPLVTRGEGLAVDRIRQHVESRLEQLPRYRQRLAFTPLTRHPIWVDDDRFNLHYHVRHTSLPRPGTEQSLKALAGRIMSQQLDREKPLWEMWLIEGLESGGFAVLAKIHHCMVDGIAGTNVLTQLLDASPDANPEGPAPWLPRPAPSAFELVVDEAVYRARVPITALRALRGALREPRRTAAEVAEAAGSIWDALTAGLRVVAATPLNRPTGTHRRVDWQTLDLAALKELKKRLDGTINDVVLTITAGAVRRFLAQRHARLDTADYRVCIPVNMRAGATEEQLANRVSAWFLSLPIDEADPLRRFEKVRRETRRLKRSRAARGTDLFTQFVGWTSSSLLTYAGVQLASWLRPYNMIVTNVPGPQFPVYLLGARMQAIYPQLPLLENQGLGVAVMSYLGQVCWGLVGDWDLCADLPAFSAAIEASFEELGAAAERRTR